MPEQYNTTSANHESLTDKERVERILRTPTPLNDIILANLNGDPNHKDAAAAYSSSVEATLFPADGEVDKTSPLRTRLKDVVDELVTTPEYTEKRGLRIEGAGLECATLASIIAVLHQNPEDFIMHMRSNQDSLQDPAQGQEFEEQVTNLTAAIYGERYNVYAEDAPALTTMSDTPELSSGLSNQELALHKKEDAAILGRSNLVSRTTQDGLRTGINSWNMFKANARNMIAAPKTFWHNRAYNSAKRRHERKIAKINPLSTSLLNEHRKASAEKTGHKLDEVERKRDDHVSILEARVDLARGKTEQRNLAYQERIDAHVEKKQAAVGRKELRKSLRSEGASRRESRDIVTHKITPEQLQHIGRAACLERSAGSIEKRIEAKSVRTQTRKDRLVDSIETTEQHISTMTKLADNFDSKAHNLYEVALPNIRGQIETKQENLALLPDDDTGSNEAPSEVDALRMQEHQLKIRINDLHESATQTRKEVERLQRKLRRQNSRLKAQTSLAERRYDQLDTQRGLTDSHHKNKRDLISHAIKY